MHSSSLKFGLKPTELVSSLCNMNYIELMQKCWNSEPNKRPTAVNLKNEIKSMEYNEKWFNDKPTEISIRSITKNNPYAIYKSRPLSAMIKSAEFTKSLKGQRIILTLIL